MWTMPSLLPSLLLLYGAIITAPLILGSTAPAALSPQQRVESMVYHAWNNYMQHAFPADELRPLTCTPTDPKEFGGLALTLVDSLDTLAVVGNASEFRSAVALTCSALSFDADVNISVFESNIRVLGGLISAHLIATGHTDTGNPGMVISPEAGPTSSCLLVLAEDLGRRLLPAFDTPTHLPYGTVNLRHGVPQGETPVTCVAGAGTFLLEFGALSRLTGDARFESAARAANEALWSRRSKYQLLGAHINVETGAWTHEDAGVGSFVDSWYEYLLKAYILFGDERDLLMFTEAYVAALRHLKRGPWYVEVNMLSSQTSWSLFGSLQCFWPALQTLFGDREQVRFVVCRFCPNIPTPLPPPRLLLFFLRLVCPPLPSTRARAHTHAHTSPRIQYDQHTRSFEQAADTMRAFMSLWDFFGFVPERYNLNTHSIPSGDASFSYALRPELAESLFYLDRAYRSTPSTRGHADIAGPSNRAEWQRFGLKMLNSLESECKVSCGFASIKNVSREASMSDAGIVTGASFEKHDHMPSFFLSETLKYLYLLFEPRREHWIDRGNFVFTTEGHILPINDRLWKRHRQHSSSSTRPREPNAQGLDESKRRLSELRQFAHAKCLKRSALSELRLAIFADAGGSRSGFLGRIIGRGDVCSMSPHNRRGDLTKTPSSRIMPQTGTSNTTSSQLCSHEESRYFSRGAPLWAEDDATQLWSRGSNSLVYESSLIERGDWIFTRDLDTIKWELQREQSMLYTSRDNDEKQRSGDRRLLLDFDSLFSGFVFALECVMRLAALFLIRFFFFL
jgi:hypothetical protein